MKVSKEEARKIYNIVVWDWAATDYKFWSHIIKFKYKFWPHIIKSKDIGLICTSVCINTDDYQYEVVDRKKWMVAKIKYGI
jgi:hypothetical protein